MLGALRYADAITTVSPTYANEIQTPEFGEGLDGVLRERSYALQGILNGIDVAGFDPATDKRIAANYTVDDRSGKAVCKAKLQEELGLEVRDDRPLMVMVTRLTRQKGMDLVMYALDRILSGGVQVAVLGTGDRDYEDGLRYFQDKYPGTMAARIEFDPALSQRMYAAADMFLMPSKFEPCGLSQIIAMRYGTLPIVRETGGLKDTVQPYNEFTGEGTGFSFSNFNGDEMGDAVFRAARLFWDNRDAWNQLVTQAMSQDFSWTRSADKYLDLYFFMHPEIERPAAVVDEPVVVAEKAAAEPEATVKEPAAAEEPKVEKKPTAEAEVKPAAKPAAKKTTTRKTTTKKATTTKATDSKTSAAKATTAKASTTRKRTTAASKKTAEAEVAPEVKAETATAEAKPAAKAPAKTAAKKTAATTKKATAAKKTTATTSTNTKAATTKAAAKTTPKAAAKPADKVEEAPSEPKAKATVEAKPAAKTTTRKRSTTTAKKTTTKAAAPKAEAKVEDKPAVKAEPAPKAAEVKTAPKATAKAEPAKEAPVSPAAPAEEKAPTKKISVRKATAARKRR